MKGGINLDPIETAVQGVKNGETRLFEVVIENFQQKLFHYCYHMLGNTEEAEDAVQDSFIRAFEKIGSYKSSISFSAWLYKITYNHCINILRRKKLMRFLPFSEDTCIDSTGIETGLEKSELGVELISALSKITPVDKSILILRILEEKNFEEISKILDIKPATLRKKYERARKKLKTILISQKGGIVNEGFTIS